MAFSECRLVRTGSFSPEYISGRLTSHAAAIFIRGYQVIQIAIATILAAGSLGKHSLRSFWTTRKVIKLLSCSTITEQNKAILSCLLGKLIESPQETNYWLGNQYLSVLSGRERDGDFLLKNIFRGWQLVQDQDALMPPRETPLTRLDYARKTFVIDCLRFQEAIHDLQSILPVPPSIAALDTQLKGTYRDLRARMDEIKKARFWNSRILFYHNRDAFSRFHISGSMPFISNLVGKLFLQYLHVAFVGIDSKRKTLCNRHVSYVKYEENPVHDIELLGSDIDELDISNMMVPQKKRALMEVFHASTEEDLSKLLNEKFEQKIVDLQQTALKNGIKNSFWTRLKTMLCFPPIRDNGADLPLKGSIQCSHFVALVIMKALQAVDRECQEALQSNESCVRKLLPSHTNLARITPSSLRKILESMTRPFPYI